MNKNIHMQEGEREEGRKAYAEPMHRRGRTQKPDLKASWKPMFEIACVPIPRMAHQGVVMVVCPVPVVMLSIELLVPWNWPWTYSWSA